MKENDIKEGFWVFISHSNKDFEKVRLVRNELEENGFRPILLYLKCMEDEDEIDILIKREIDSRRRFILCDSPNAKASKYVQSEINYIRSKKRMYEVIDLSKIDLNKPSAEKTVMGLIHPFKRRTTVFLSYNRHDLDFAFQLSQQLKYAGFNVYDKDFHLNGAIGGNDYPELIKKEIIKTLGNGYVIGLFGEKSSLYSMEEIKFAYKMEPHRVLPVFISEQKIKELPYELRVFNIVDVSHITQAEERAKIIIDKLLSLDQYNQQQIY